MVGLPEEEEIGYEPAVAEICGRGIYTDVSGVVNTRSRSNDRLRDRRPRETDSGREPPVLRIFLVPAGLDPRKFALHACRGLNGIPVHIPDLAEFLGIRCLVLPTDAQVQCEAVGHSVVVLEEQAVVLLIQKQRVRDGKGSGNRDSKEHTREPVTTVQSRAVGIRALRVSAIEIELTSGILRVIRIQLNQLQIGSKSDVVTTLDPVQLILQLPGVLRVQSSRRTAQRAEVIR